MAFVRSYEGARVVTLANCSDQAAVYDPALVEGLAPLAASQGAPQPGLLRPLEAVVWG
jgi:hypothetical protein